MLLALLVGAVGVVTLAGAAGARRTSSALGRFRESTRSADLELAVPKPTPPQVRRLVDAPGVAAVATSVAYAIVIPKAPDFQAIRMPSSPSFGRTVDRLSVGCRACAESAVCCCAARFVILSSSGRSTL